MNAANSEFCSKDLLQVVRDLNCRAPLTTKLEEALKVGPGYGHAWYSSQREHWLRWLEEYPTAGPYGRNAQESTRAKVVYNRVNCPPMVFWLAEAVGVDNVSLTAAHVSALAAPRNQASQAGAIRSKLTWDIVFLRLSERKVLLRNLIGEVKS